MTKIRPYQELMQDLGYKGSGLQFGYPNRKLTGSPRIYAAHKAGKPERFLLFCKTESVLSQFEYVRTQFFFIRCAVVTRSKAVLTPSYYVLSTRSANGVGLSENGLEKPEMDSISVASYG
ncbi:hypothetical protein DPMN_074799 [Dreissena polymorpha]|uniref:Uncharacterized protein n=1 Tax=Dreissena polymorpha TaxID=45954 RepID=A0A9D3YG07_DREPO|nr:hypothetical protein DPMN_074799 [Dreissena polymorpha]